MSDPDPVFSPSPGKTALSLFYILLFLIAAQVTGLIVKYGFGHGWLFGLVPLFNFNTEQNIPTLYNTILLLLNSGLLFLVRRSPGTATGPRWVWLLLSVVFLILAMDEFCEIHEKLSAPFHSKFDTTGLLYYAWVIPYGIISLLLLLFFIPVWWKLERKIRFLFALAAILYFSGSIVFEMLGGRVFEQLGDQLSLKGGILATFEESLEMGGLIILSYGLMLLLVRKSGSFSIRIS
jgi:hypothetical protein